MCLSKSFYCFRFSTSLVLVKARILRSNKLNVIIWVFGGAESKVRVQVRRPHEETVFKQSYRGVGKCWLGMKTRVAVCIDNPRTQGGHRWRIRSSRPLLATQKVWSQREVQGSLSQERGQGQSEEPLDFPGHSKNSWARLSGGPWVNASWQRSPNIPMGQPRRPAIFCN